MTDNLKSPFSIACILLVWILSLMPFIPDTPFNQVKFIDKWVHFVMYGGTCSVIWLEYARHHQRPDYEKLFFWAWLAPIVMSGILELLQEYCVGRNGSWLDLLANAIGVTMAAALGPFIIRLFSKR